MLKKTLLVLAFTEELRRAMSWKASSIFWSMGSRIRL